LIGCGIPDPDYWQQVVQAAAIAARAALRQLRPARLRYVMQPIGKLSYNRRAVLADGRVVMAMHPDAPVVKVGPTLDSMLLARFEDEQGRGIVGLVAWAAHACVMCTLAISADYPGELRRRLAHAQGGMPFIYLQGACANINLPMQDTTRAQVLADVDALLNRIGDITWPGSAAPTALHLAHATLPLAYQSLPTPAELLAWRAGMDRIAQTGAGPALVTASLANLLNAPPRQWPAIHMVRHTAASLAEWSRQLLEAGPLPASCDLAVQVLWLGPLTLCVVAAEVFAETALAIQQLFPDRPVIVVGYGSPLVGYLPTDEALDEGGYEVDHAYRFYGHPAPFARGSEARLLRTLHELISRNPSYRPPPQPLSL
jgi:hypothetical protein